MKNILETIVLHKQKEVELLKIHTSKKKLEGSPLFERETISMKEWVSDPEKTGIIAEFKRYSPSKGVINATAKVTEVTSGYRQAGASAISVLTDRQFFGGKNIDLIQAREVNDCPLLRKDFIIDEHQILEAKSIGADCILLIAAVLTPKRLQELAQFAKSLELEVLMEIHNIEELQYNLIDEIDLLGVNNRNLKTFQVSLDNSIALSGIIPDKYVKVSESGIRSAEDIVLLREYGFQGFLIGESFMKTNHPASASQQFMRRLNALSLEVA